MTSYLSFEDQITQNLSKTSKGGSFSALDYGGADSSHGAKALN